MYFFSVWKILWGKKKEIMFFSVLSAVISMPFSFTLYLLITQDTFLDSVDQDQTAENMQSDL